MTKLRVQSKLAFGTFVIVASLFNTASAQPVMLAQDLEYFRIDCRIKEQQMVFLQSLRTTPDQRLGAGFINAVTPWRVITDSTSFRQNVQVHNGNTNWLITQLILKLSKDCP